VSIDLEQLRLAAALAHTAPDADPQLLTLHRLWIVSYERDDADADPCTLRNLVLATMRGCQLGLLPAQAVSLIGKLRPSGGGSFRRTGPASEERRIATFLSPSRLSEMLESCPMELPDDAVRAEVKADDDLGVTVVNITASAPEYCRHLDELARWAATTCLVAELTGTPRVQQW